MRGEWIEICHTNHALAVIVSLPMRGEWIEIGEFIEQHPSGWVSPHAGRVD